MDSAQFIVAEISKNWWQGESVSDTPLLCQQFETAILVNLARGYRLHSFQLHRLVTREGGMNETIVAVFERQPGAANG